MIEADDQKEERCSLQDGVIITIKTIARAANIFLKKALSGVLVSELVKRFNNELSECFWHLCSRGGIKCVENA